MKLDTLDVTKNRLTSLEGVTALVELTDLWAGSNAIETFDAVKPAAACPKLETLYLEHNPLASDYEYRMRLTAMIETLQQIDATPVRRA